MYFIHLYNFSRNYLDVKSIKVKDWSRKMLISFFKIMDKRQTFF